MLLLTVHIHQDTDLQVLMKLASNMVEILMII